MTVRIVQAEAAHIPHLAEHMRISDQDEVWAWSMVTPGVALEQSLAGSVLSWTGLVDDVPAAMFGVGGETLLSGAAAPWFLGTDTLERIPYALARLSKAYMMRMRIFPILANWSDARNTRSHAWLRWLGFGIGAAQPMGPLEQPFRPFVMRCS